MELRPASSLLAPSRSGALLERLLAPLYRSSRAARIARRLGLQRIAVRVVEHEVAASAWPPGAPPLRLAFASDFHAGPTTHPRLLELAARRLADARPHLLLLGGDYVYHDAAAVGPLARLLGEVPAPLGRYAVLGNHDWWHDPSGTVRALEAAGIEVLFNRSVTLPPPWDGVSVVGLDDPWMGRPDPEAAFRGSAGVRILLMHSPSGLVLVGQRPFDLALCGHTHGGQIALPGGWPLHVPNGPLCRRFAHGRHAIAGPSPRTLIVSRGIGTVMVPVRLFAPSDVLVLTLHG